MTRATSPIFDGTEETHLMLDGHDCVLPLCYWAGTATIGMFPARLSKLRAKSPDRRIDPAEIAPGIAAVAVIAFEFDTSIGPVNEVCVAVPLRDAHAVHVPGLSLLGSLRRGLLPVWIWHLPVSTQIANVMGREVWGFNKIHADIPIEQDVKGRRVCHLSHDGTPVLDLHGPAATGTREMRIKAVNHLWQSGNLQTADHEFHLHDMGVSLTPGTARLDLLSDHPIARDLKDVLLSHRSISYAYAPRLQALLHEPDRMSLSLARKLLAASEAYDRQFASQIPARG